MLYGTNMGLYDQVKSTTCRCQGPCEIPVQSQELHWWCRHRRSGEAHKDTFGGVKDRLFLTHQSDRGYS